MALAQTKHQLGELRAILRDWFPLDPEVLTIPLGIAWQIGREAVASFNFKFWVRELSLIVSEFVAISLLKTSLVPNEPE